MAGWVAVSILRPLRHALRSATRIAGGDLSLAIKVESNDEVGQLLAAMHGMSSKLAEIIGEVRVAADLRRDAGLRRTDRHHRRHRLPDQSRDRAASQSAA